MYIGKINAVKLRLSELVVALVQQVPNSGVNWHTFSSSFNAARYQVDICAALNVQSLYSHPPVVSSSSRLRYQYNVYSNHMLKPPEKMCFSNRHNGNGIRILNVKIFLWGYITDRLH